MCFQTLIDYLKFDIEFEEWKAIQTMVIDGALENVKQLRFEMHMKHPQDAQGADLQVTKDDFLGMHENLKLLEEMNFKQFNYRLNPFCNDARGVILNLKAYAGKTCNNPKFFDRRVRANSIDSNQVAP